MCSLTLVCPSRSTNSSRRTSRCKSFRVNKARKLTQAKAGKILGIPQPHVSDLMRGGARAFSAERLMEFFTALGHDVEIRVKRTRKGHGQLSVIVAA